MGEHKLVPQDTVQTLLATPESALDVEERTGEAEGTGQTEKAGAGQAEETGQAEGAGEAERMGDGERSESGDEPAARRGSVEPGTTSPTGGPKVLGGT